MASAVRGVVALVMAVVYFTGRDPRGELPGFAVAALFAIILGGLWAYDGVQLALWGRTLGMRIMKLRVAAVARPDAPLSTGRGLGRAAVYPMGFWIVGLIPLVGLANLLNTLWLLWDRPLKQCLHDKLARTVVLDAPSRPARPLQIPAIAGAVAVLTVLGIGIAIVTEQTRPERAPRAPTYQDLGLPTPGPSPRITARTAAGPEFTRIENACAMVPRVLPQRITPGATAKPGRETDGWACNWASSQKRGGTQVSRGASVLIALQPAQSGGESGTTAAVRVRNALITIEVSGKDQPTDRNGLPDFGGTRPLGDAEARRAAADLARAVARTLRDCDACSR